MPLCWLAQPCSQEGPSKRGKRWEASFCCSLACLFCLKSSFVTGPWSPRSLARHPFRVHWKDIVSLDA